MMYIFDVLLVSKVIFRKLLLSLFLYYIFLICGVYICLFDNFSEILSIDFVI